MGGTGLVITPMPTVMFGLIDGASYSDYDGKHGHYTYHAAGGIVTMMDGSPAVLNAIESRLQERR